MSKTKILIYEDKRPDHQRLAKELMKSELYDVIPNIDPNGKYPYSEFGYYFDNRCAFDYINKIIQENWDDGLKMIICDLLVKDANSGKELIESIRTDKKFCVNDSRAFSATIPIIAYTHSVSRKDIDDALKAGANDYALKPAKSTDPKIVEENEERMEKLKNSIKEQIIYFDKKLSLMKNEVPDGIREKVRQFKIDNKGKTTAFIMTPFSEEHKETITAIKKILHDNGITEYIADAPGGQFVGDLLPNIQIMLHGCKFGVGVYTDVSKLPTSAQQINANLSLEVGYMLALQKEVFLLKDKSLGELNSDLAGKLYVPFDKTNLNDLKEKFETWLKHRKFIGK
jgi:CheY-like chemotaxis protein